MQVTGVERVVPGLPRAGCPSDELPTIASLPQTMERLRSPFRFRSLYGLFKASIRGLPITSRRRRCQAEAARTRSSAWTGLGITVGVSFGTSVESSINGGLAGVVQYRRLQSPANPVRVIQDDPSGSGTDEGLRYAGERPRHRARSQLAIRDSRSLSELWLPCRTSKRWPGRRITRSLVDDINYAR